MAERIHRDYSKPNSYETIKATELRSIVDKYLNLLSYSVIAVAHGRTSNAVKHLIEGKIPTDYSEGGKRERPVYKLMRAKSSLDYNREPSKRDIAYCKKLKRRGRGLNECSVILHLSTERLKAIKVGFLGLFDLEKTNGVSRIRPRNSREDITQVHRRES